MNIRFLPRLFSGLTMEGVGRPEADDMGRGVYAEEVHRHNNREPKCNALDAA